MLHPINFDVTGTRLSLFEFGEVLTYMHVRDFEETRLHMQPAGHSFIEATGLGVV